jgi:hypothetical protein
MVRNSNSDGVLSIKNAKHASSDPAGVKIEVRKGRGGGI